VHVSNGQGLTAERRRLDDLGPRPLGDPSAPLPAIDRVLLLIQGGRHGGNGRPYRKYVVKGLHGTDALTDYLSVQERTEKQVTPLFRHLTMLGMKGNRKASTPSQWRKDFISRVKAARIVSGRKPVEVAAELGVNLDTYNRWETRALLPHHLVMTFCRITGADPVMLLTGSPFDLGKLLSQDRRT
jgi:hypothetical protein